jgi:pyruvate dehydrogenase E1 component beta subunit
LILERSGVDAEVVDLRTVKPLDVALIRKSVRKTGRAVIADPGWRTCGLAAEVAAVIAEDDPGCLKSPIRRVTLPDIPAPASRSLEEKYYINSNHIVDAVTQSAGVNIPL